MMEERYRATTQNRFYPDMSNINKNITVKAKLISPPTYKYGFSVLVGIDEHRKKNIFVVLAKHRTPP
jgi:hypothetical protein